MKRRVVITGTGAVTSLGIGTDELWQSVKNGKCGVSCIERIDVSDMPSKVGAEIKNFDPADFMDKHEARRMDRFTQYALAAAQMAIGSSALNLDKVNRERMGSIIGTGIGGFETVENQIGVLLDKGPKRVSPFFIPMMIPNMASGNIAIKYGIKGFNECVVSACATSANAIGDAFKAIQRGDADVMITGGSEAPITRMAIAGFCANKTMTTNSNPLEASKPFDLERDGFVIGEGAGILILEEFEHAAGRGADIIAEVTGYGCTNDAYHITAPSENGEGSARCMRIALQDAGINASDIGYINAHGTSTKLNDQCETIAIKAVFQEDAYKLPVSSTKSMTGHLFGAAGAVETILTALALKENFLPPTINYNTPDPECDLYYIPGKGISANIEYALTNSFGFGGHNATLVLKSYR